MREMLKSMHILFEEHYSHRIRPADYVYYDYILAMDDSNIEGIQLLVALKINNNLIGCLILQIIYTILTYTTNLNESCW